MAGVTLHGVFLICVGLFCLLSPRRAIGAIGYFASTDLINFAELSIRALVGIAWILAASATPFPVYFAAVGWFLTVSSVVILSVPRRWHAAYAVFWSRQMPVWVAMASAPVSILTGGALIYWMVF